MYGILRPEARPRSIKDLTRSQLEGADRILATLESAIEELSTDKRRNPSAATRESRVPSSNSSDLDQTRANRIFFLSGEAGTGKTTVYLSLRAVLETGAAEKQARVLVKEIRLLGEQNSQQAKKLQRADGVVDKAKKRGSRVVWLEPLTVETIASTQTNYLAAVLARVDRVLAGKLWKRPGKERPPNLFEHGDLSDVLNRFQRLRNEIGLAWQGNLPKRGEHLDPDVYAEEMMRAEEARIHINKRLHDVLEDLTEELYSHEEGPIFVLPVDDLSLNPGPSLEILRLLRLISVPRLFIFAMGDPDGFEELAFQKYYGDIVALAGHDTLGVERQQRLMARARNLAFDALRKLLPPAQRFRLEVLFWNETLNLRSSDAGVGAVAADQQNKSLLQLLKEWELKTLNFGHEAENTPSNLLEFLGKPGESKIRLSEEPGTETHGNDAFINAVEGIEDAYTPMQILEAPYRSALDLWIEVAHRKTILSDIDGSEVQEHIKDRKWRDALFSWIAEQTLRALNEQNYMSYTDRERCEEAIRGSQYTSMRLDTNVLSLELDYGTETARRCPNRFGSLVVRQQRRWRLGPRPVPGEAQSALRYSNSFAPSAEGPGPRTRRLGKADGAASEKLQVGSWKFMPPRPAAWFILLHDLLVLTPKENLLGGPLTPHWDKHQWAGIRWSPPYSDPWRTQGTNFFPWPAPRWPSFWQFDSFLCAWNHIVRLAADCRSMYEWDDLNTRLAFWWIRLATDVFLLKENSYVFDLEGDLPLGRPSNSAEDPKCNPPNPGGDRGSDEPKDEDPDMRKQETPWCTLAADLGILLERVQEANGGSKGKTSNQLEIKPTSEIPIALADAERWFLHLVLMTLPEYGLSPTVLAWLRTCASMNNVKQLWQGEEKASYIRQVRATNLERLLDEELKPEAGWHTLVAWKEPKKEVPGEPQEDHPVDSKGSEKRDVGEPQEDHPVELKGPEKKDVLVFDGRPQEDYHWDPSPRDIYLARKARLEAQGSSTKQLKDTFGKIMNGAGNNTGGPSNNTTEAGSA